MKTQIGLKCPKLTQQVLTKKALKRNSPNGGDPTILQPAEYRIIQTEALSIMDSETGDIEILCAEISVSGTCQKTKKGCVYLKNI